MKNFIFLLLHFFFISSFAQDLIINGGFEKYTKCPDTLGKITYAIGWKNSNPGSVDYYNTCAKNSSVTIPENYQGSSFPHTGNAYAGFGIIRNLLFEFLQTKLTSPLNPDNSYCLKLFLKRSQKYPFSFNELSFLFSKSEVRSTNYSFYNEKLIEANNLISYSFPSPLKNEWTCVHILYKPKMSEQFLTIGLNKSKEDKQDSYYYIDDVSLTELKNGKECSCADTIAVDYSTAMNNPLTLQNITFKTNSAVLLDISYTELSKLATYIKSHPQLKIELSGHTDNVGKEADNLKLSESRAKAVADYLISQGVIQNRIKYKGYGSTKPIGDNVTEENRAKNRRVQVIFR